MWGGSKWCSSLKWNDQFLRRVANAFRAKVVEWWLEIEGYTGPRSFLDTSFLPCRLSRPDSFDACTQRLFDFLSFIHDGFDALQPTLKIAYILIFHFSFFFIKHKSSRHDGLMVLAAHRWLIFLVLYMMALDNRYTLKQTVTIAYIQFFSLFDSV